MSFPSFERRSNAYIVRLGLKLCVAMAGRAESLQACVAMACVRKEQKEDGKETERGRQRNKRRKPKETRDESAESAHDFSLISEALRIARPCPHTESTGGWERPHVQPQ